MATKRRMGPENAEMRTRLMAAVESLLREKGYAALSARNVATYAGVKYPLVFYYFETMDDLLLTTYRRRTQSVLERAERLSSQTTPCTTCGKLPRTPMTQPCPLSTWPCAITTL